MPHFDRALLDAPDDLADLRAVLGPATGPRPTRAARFGTDRDPPSAGTPPRTHPPRARRPAA